MGTAKHLALEKFEAVDMALRGPITPGQRAGSTHSGIVSTNAVDKAAELRHTALFRSAAATHLMPSHGVLWAELQIPGSKGRRRGVSHGGSFAQAVAA